MQTNDFKLPSQIEYERRLEEQFPRNLYPHDCETCRNRCDRRWDTSFGKDVRHFCSKGCLLDHLAGKAKDHRR